MQPVDIEANEDINIALNNTIKEVPTNEQISTPEDEDLMEEKVARIAELEKDLITLNGLRRSRRPVKEPT